MTQRNLVFVLSAVLAATAFWPPRASANHSANRGVRAAHSASQRMDFRLERARSFSFLARTQVAMQHEDGSPLLIDGPAFLVRALRPGLLRIDEDMRRLMPNTPGM